MISLRGFLFPIAVFVILSLACSAADLVQRQRETPTVTAVGVLIPTFTPTPLTEVTSIVVTPPAQDKPGVIIVPPGMDPSSVLPELPTLTSTLVPTNTEPPLQVATPGEGTDGELTPLPTASPGLPVATGTPPPTLTPTPAIPPTATPVPTPTFTFTPLPTPTAFVRVVSGLVALRSGPGVQYPSIAQLGPEVPVAIIGRSPDGAWLEICCISGESVWVATQHVTVINDVSNVPQSLAGPPPTPTSTFTSTITPTPTPSATATPYPFERALGPQFFPTNNEFITIWAKLFIGEPPLEEAAPGYFLEVFFEGIPRPDTAGRPASKDVFEFSAPPGSGSRVEYNLKYEYRPPDPATLDAGSELTPLQLIGTGTWTVYVSDGAGRQLSDPVTFTTAPSNPNREIYIGWVRVR